jgi:hypothetical protein
MSRDAVCTQSIASSVGRRIGATQSASQTTAAQQQHMGVDNEDDERGTREEDEGEMHGQEGEMLKMLWMWMVWVFMVVGVEGVDGEM